MVRWGNRSAPLHPPDPLTPLPPSLQPSCSGRGNQIAYFWEGNDLGHERAVTYQWVLDETCRVLSVGSASVCVVSVW